MNIPWDQRVRVRWFCSNRKDAWKLLEETWCLKTNRDWGGGGHRVGWWSSASLSSQLPANANSGQEQPVICLQVYIGGHSSRLRDLEDSQLWWAKVICTLTKPKPGAERTKGQKLSGGADLLAAPDSPRPTCYPIWLNSHFTYRGAGTVTERPAGSGQMPLPIKLWGRLPKKGHIKMESVHPTFKYRGLSKRLGLMRAARRGLISTNVLTFPLRTAKQMLS